MSRFDTKSDSNPIKLHALLFIFESVAKNDRRRLSKSAESFSANDTTSAAMNSSNSRLLMRPGSRLGTKDVKRVAVLVKRTGFVPMGNYRIQSAVFASSLPKLRSSLPKMFVSESHIRMNQ